MNRVSFKSLVDDLSKTRFVIGVRELSYGLRNAQEEPVCYNEFGDA